MKITMKHRDTVVEFSDADLPNDKKASVRWGDQKESVLDLIQHMADQVIRMEYAKSRDIVEGVVKQYKQ